MLLATVFFAGMQVCVKMISHLPTVQVVFFRAIVALGLCLVMLKRAGVSPWGTQRGWLLARGIAGTSALTLFFYTLQVIPLGTAVTLQNLAPVFTILIAGFAFREGAQAKQWIGIAIAFCGIIAIQGFDTRVSLGHASLAILSAVGSAVAYNIIRKIGTSEHPLVIVFYFPLVTFVVLTPFTIWQWQWPSAQDWLFLLLTGVFVQIAQVNMTKAYQSQKAADIVAIKYLGPVLAVLLGYIIFGELFSWQVLLGMGLVIAGATYSTIAKQKPSQSSAAG